MLNVKVKKCGIALTLAIVLFITVFGMSIFGCARLPAAFGGESPETGVISMFDGISLACDSAACAASGGFAFAFDPSDDTDRYRISLTTDCFISSGVLSYCVFCAMISKRYLISGASAWRGTPQISLRIGGNSPPFAHAQA